LRKVKRAPSREASRLAKDKGALALCHEIADQRNDVVLARPVAKLRSNMSRIDPLFPAVRRKIPEASVTAYDAFVERHGSFGPPKDSCIEPALKAVCITDYRG